MKTGKLLFLSHPGTQDIFSGYGLVITEDHLVGVLMVDRPKKVDPKWLKEIKENFGGYQLVEMTETKERGIVCQMFIEKESVRFLKTLDHPVSALIRDALFPLLENPPRVTLALKWDPVNKLWCSTIIRETELHSNAWILPAPEAAKAVYQTALEKLLPDHPEDWSLFSGLFKSKPMLVLLWEPTANMEIPKRVERLVLLAGGAELKGEPKDALLAQLKARRKGIAAKEPFDTVIIHHPEGTVWWDF